MWSKFVLSTALAALLSGLSEAEKSSGWRLLLCSARLWAGRRATVGCDEPLVDSLPDAAVWLMIVLYLIGVKLSGQR